jgi:hypothetical protein
MLFASTSTASLLASIGTVSSATFDSIAPYIYVAAGLGIAFYVARKLISLIPKK